ncbi:protein kinase [Rhodococcus sp. NPDC058514]|uniref:serine/threonine-protein kinase n=1 Tax=unclassified Rhodococcus (in: high G+C Gram-positive bacteria) TaxID=192944 RepID=UPI00366777BF
MNEPVRPTSDETIASGPLTELAPDIGMHGSPTASSDTTGSHPERGLVVDSGVRRLAADWEATRAPADLTDYLPDAAAIRRAALIDLVRVDLEYRWLRGGQPKRIADYCLEFPELLAEPLPPELVYDEFRVRRASGATVEPNEYLLHFPQQADRFEWLLEHDMSWGPGASTPIELPENAEFAVGQQLDDFDLVAELGHGAFARVFLARQLSMQRPVALKISRNVGTEPQTLAQLDHPYIVRVFDQRLIEDRQVRVLVMEYVPGGTLLDVVKVVRATPPEQRTGQLLIDTIDKVLARKGEVRPSESSVRAEIAALSWPETVAWIGLRLADALEYACAHGVLHRDVKPANVLLSVEGVPKLADFNVSSSDAVDPAGRAGFVGGSVAYMAPEQLAAVSAGSTVPESASTAAPIDTRSDIYALGVMLWELLTGVRPFDDAPAGGAQPSPDEVLAIRRRGVNPAARATVPADCPAALSRVLMTSLAFDPDDRWSSGRKLARQFALCLDPHARDLVDPRPGSWRGALSRWSLPILLAAIGIPNLLAAGYNYYYNRVLIISGLSPEAQDHLELVHLVIGGLAFPLGAILILYWCRLALIVPRGLRRGQRYEPEILGRARTATLNLGHRAVVVSFALWVVAGVAYPIALQVAAGGIPSSAYSHLIASLAVCGAVAVAYPFFILTFYAVRCVYPILLSHGEIGSADGRDLRALGRIITRYLAVAASVPLVGVAGLSFVGADPGNAVNATVRALCVGGIVAFIGVYQLFGWIGGDLRALIRVVSLSGPAAGARVAPRSG